MSDHPKHDHFLEPSPDTQSAEIVCRLDSANITEFDSVQVIVKVDSNSPNRGGTQNTDSTQIQHTQEMAVTLNGKNTDD